jgi:hypothetical protein
MATVYKILGQSAPAATTETLAYTAGNQAVLSSITICNQAATSATFRIAVRPAADLTTTQKHWIVYGSTVAANDSTIITPGITLATGDKVFVYASTTTMSFSVFGTELS